MKIFWNSVYIVWVVITIIFFTICSIKSFPVYVDNEFPLFTDILVVIFTPSVFIVGSTFIHFSKYILKNYSFRNVLNISILIGLIIYINSILNFGKAIKIILLGEGLGIGFVYYILTEMIFRKSNFYIK